MDPQTFKTIKCLQALDRFTPAECDRLGEILVQVLKLKIEKSMLDEQIELAVGRVELINSSLQQLMGESDELQSKGSGN